MNSFKQSDHLVFRLFPQLWGLGVAFRRVGIDGKWRKMTGNDWVRCLSSTPISALCGMLMLRMYISHSVHVCGILVTNTTVACCGIPSYVVQTEPTQQIVKSVVYFPYSVHVCGILVTGTTVAGCGIPSYVVQTEPTQQIVLRLRSKKGRRIPTGILLLFLSIGG